MPFPILTKERLHGVAGAIAAATLLLAITPASAAWNGQLYRCEEMVSRCGQACGTADPLCRNRCEGFFRLCMASSVHIQQDPPVIAPLPPPRPVPHVPPRPRGGIVKFQR